MKLASRIVICTLAAFAVSSCARTKVDWIPVSETAHFAFFTPNGTEDAVPLLANELEANYDRITGDLLVAPDQKFPVYVFGDVGTYHQALGPDAPAASSGPGGRHLQGRTVVAAGGWKAGRLMKKNSGVQSCGCCRLFHRN